MPAKNTVERKQDMRQSPVQVERLTEQAFAVYGRILGLPYPGKAPASAFSFPNSDFWQVAEFDPGDNGQTEVLWVNYRNDSLLVGALEVHWLTEQAIVPLYGGDLIHVVCASQTSSGQQPDLSTIRAFRVPVGQGVCMQPGCWHASFVLNEQTTCLMLTRRSTTRDLVNHLQGSGPANESTICTIEPQQVHL